MKKAGFYDSWSTNSHKI